MEDNVTTLEDQHICSGATETEMELYYDMAWWLDGVVQVAMGLIGLLGNSVAIPILLSKKLNSIFNRILVFLAVFDNIFLFCSILEGIRKNFGPLHQIAHVYAFAYFLYQLQSMAIVSSIFTTVVLALERCLAVAKPIEYHNAIQGTNPWRRVIHYIVPVIFISITFTTPKYFEIDVVDLERKVQMYNESTNMTMTTVKQVVSVKPTDLRMNDAYIFYYNNLAKLIITGIVPFVALCVFNTKIYCALRRRRNVMGPNATAAHQQQLNEDNRQALVLFGIVVIFFVSNVPRILLNLHEVFTIDDYKEELSKGCTNLPLWVLLSGNFSQLFMVANSSLNFFIYCFMSSVFRGVFIGNLGFCARLCLSPISAPLQRMGSFCKRKEDKESSTSPAGNGKMTGGGGEDPLITINEQTLDLDNLRQEDHLGTLQHSPLINDKDLTPTLDSNV